MKTTATACALACVLALSACASSGVKVTENQTAAFEKGKTTRQEVIAKLGKPTMQTSLGDGTKLVHYTYAEATVRPSTFIPLVGAFVGGTDSQSSHVSMRFDAQDKLIDITTSESQMGTGTGFAAGAIAPSTDQPRRP